MALGETSLPVPAVVGRQASQRPFFLIKPVPKQSSALVAVDEGCDEFGHVEHRAAADAGYAVGAELAADFEDGFKVVECRLSEDITEHLYAHAVLPELCERGLDERKDGRSGEHEKAFVTEFEVVVDKSLYAA